MKLSDQIGRALVGAAKNGHREIVVLLIEIIKTNPDLTMKLSDHLGRALVGAAENGHRKIVGL